MLTAPWRSVSDQKNRAESDFVSLSDIMGFARRYAISIAICMAIAVSIAWFYVATSDPIYTARAQMLIDPKLPQLLQQQQTGDVNLSLDTAQIESQIAVMQSEKIAWMVIEELGLKTDATFNRSRSPDLDIRLQRFFAIIGVATGWAEHPWFVNTQNFVVGLFADDAATRTAPTEFEQDRRTMNLFRGGLDVRRLGVSYAIDITFRSLDAENAAAVANAVSEQFVREQVETKAQAAREGGAWLESRLNEMRAQMNEATQIAQAFRAKHDYSVAPRAERELDTDGQTPQSPTLEELVVTADTYRKMYESFLQAYTSSVSQQSYPVADARVITPATPPLSASAPRSKLALVFGALAGLMGGVSLAFLRFTLDNTVRSARQVRHAFDVDCLGELPTVGYGRNRAGRLDEARRAPRSRFTDAMREAKTAINLAEAAHPMRCIGLTSPAGSYARSVVASNLALLYAASGMRTLVIDADIDHAGLSRALAPRGASAQVYLEDEAIEHSVVPIFQPGYDLIPSSFSAARGLLNPKNFKAVLADLEDYDVILVDLPPLSSGAEKLAIGGMLDGIIPVAEWGETSMELLAGLVTALHANKCPIIGLVIAKVVIASRDRYRR